jgi:hypothetical protein
VIGRKKDPIAISEHELVDLTEQLDEMHHETFGSFRESLDEWREAGADVHDGVSRLAAAPTSRRGFLLGGGAVLGGVALFASGATGITAAAARTRAAGGVPTGVPALAPLKRTQKLTGDLAVVGLAASLENLAVATYQGGIDAATAGKLGAVPPAVVTFATTAQGHHKQHAAAWNAILTSSKKSAVTGVDLTVKHDVDAAFAQVTDVPGLAKLALTLENGAAATYLSAINVVKVPAGIKTAATIQPVEMQHAAILNFLLGQYPVPDSFSKLDGARTIKDRIG